MKISLEWIQSFFDKKLPSVDEIGSRLSETSFEYEGSEVVDGDTILEFDILPNRTSDCLSHYGIAREISIVFDIPMKEVELNYNIEKENENLIDVKVDSKKCYRYISVVVDNVKVKESPEWMIKRLEAMGQKSINNIVDATNYCLFELGYPLHVFDYEKLDKQILVREAKNENIELLDGEKIELNNGDLLITDGKDPIAFAGIKGGKKAELSDDTKTICLEAAMFDFSTIRKSSREHDINTTASSHFSKNMSRYMPAAAMNRLVDVVKEVAGGEVIAVNEYFEEKKNPVISFDHSDIEKLLGISIGKDKVQDILTKLNFEYSVDNDRYSITGPMNRVDVNIKEDVIEEIVRIYGLSKVEAVPLDLIESDINRGFYLKNKILDILISIGFVEVILYTLSEKGDIKLKKSLAQDKEYLRTNLTDGLKDALDRNILNVDLFGVDVVKLVEIGKVFKNGKEIEMLGIAIGAKKGNKLVKNSFEELKEKLEESGFKIEKELNDSVLEVELGEVVKNANDVEKEDFKSFDGKYTKYSIYPYIARDISFFTDNTESKEIENILLSKAGSLCTNIRLFDDFEKDGKRSVAFRLVFQSDDKTLTDKEVNSIMEDIESEVSKRGWTLR